MVLPEGIVPTLDELKAREEVRILYLRDIDGFLTFEKSYVINDTDAATQAKYGVFWILPFPCVVVNVRETHSTAETTAATLTLDVEKLTGTQAEGAGNSILASVFDLKGTANTPVTKLPSATNADIRLDTDNRLGVILSAAGNEINNVVITITLKVRLNNLPT